MTTKHLLLLLITLVCSEPIFAQTQNDKDAERLRKIKLEIAKLGTGKNSTVAVKLKDKTKLNGLLVEIKDTFFVLDNEKIGAPVSVDYAQVQKVGYYDPALHKNLRRLAIADGALTAFFAPQG